jgi:hypothetical protein
MWADVESEVDYLNPLFGSEQVAVVIERIVDSLCQTGTIDDEATRRALDEALSAILSEQLEFSPRTLSESGPRAATSCSGFQLKGGQLPHRLASTFLSEIPPGFSALDL